MLCSGLCTCVVFVLCMWAVAPLLTVCRSDQSRNPCQITRLGWGINFAPRDKMEMQIARFFMSTNLPKLEFMPQGAVYGWYWTRAGYNWKEGLWVAGYCHGTLHSLLARPYHMDMYTVCTRCRIAIHISTLPYRLQIDVHKVYNVSLS